MSTQKNADSASVLSGADSMEQLKQWVAETAKVTQPDQVVFCDGSEEESKRLTAQMLQSGELRWH